MPCLKTGATYDPAKLWLPEKGLQSKGWLSVIVSALGPMLLPTVCLRDKTMNGKLVYITNDEKQNYPFSTLELKFLCH